MIGFQSIHDARRVIRAARKTEQLQLRDTRRLRNRHAVRPGQRWIPFKNTLGRDLPPHSLVRVMPGVDRFSQMKQQTILQDGEQVEIVCAEITEPTKTISTPYDGACWGHKTLQDGLGWMTLDFPAMVAFWQIGSSTDYVEKLLKGSLWGIQRSDSDFSLNLERRSHVVYGLHGYVLLGEPIYDIGQDGGSAGNVADTGVVLMDKSYRTGFLGVCDNQVTKGQLVEVTPVGTGQHTSYAVLALNPFADIDTSPANTAKVWVEWVPHSAIDGEMSEYAIGTDGTEQTEFIITAWEC